MDRIFFKLFEYRDIWSQFRYSGQIGEKVLECVDVIANMWAQSECGQDQDKGQILKPGKNGLFSYLDWSPVGKTA